MTIGQRLLFLRRHKSLSLNELSEAIGISRSNLNRYERDLSRPTAEYIGKICKYYKVSADYLLFGKDTRELAKEGWSEGDPELEKIIRRMAELMNSENPHMRSWAIVQFAQAFPEK
jgi:transcriptional regulator with XRE-family HTH domain